MTYKQLIAYYGTQTKAADAIGVSKQVVHAWGKSDSIPIGRQLVYELHSNGELRARVSEKIRAVLSRPKVVAEHAQ